MAGRSSRRRSKTARALESEEQAAEVVRSSGRKVKRPSFYEEQSETSKYSTPASSRAASRSPTPTSAPVSRRRVSNRAKSRTVNGNASGSNTPLSRATSRSSSVASQAKQPPIKLKIKTSGRGYNPSMVNYKDSEYHYGSDFSEDEEDDAESIKSEESSEEASEDEQSEEWVESDVEFDVNVTESRPTTPIPFWLRTEEDIPALKLPASSEDLLIPNALLLSTCATYEVLRHYSLLLRLSPFRIEDFCAALNSEEQSNLLSEIHIALLKAIVRADEKDGTQFGPLDVKDSMNCQLFFMDSVTWPESLRSYLHSDPALYARPLEILEKNREYPLTVPGEDWTQTRVELLSILADQFITTNAVRDDIQSEGAQAPEDYCRVCHRLGDMLICESCSGTFHLACLDPPIHDVPEDDWKCYVCQANEVSGVTDVCSEQESAGSLHRHEPLGLDREGNKYWFVCRRIVVECKDETTRYYTSIKQFEELLAALDPDVYENELMTALTDLREEIEAHMYVTESITNEKKPGFRKSYLELENAAIEKLQEARSDAQKKEAEEKKKVAEERMLQIKEEEDQKKREEDEAKDFEEEKKRKDREERLKRREESRGDSFQTADEEMLNNVEKENVDSNEDVKEEKMEIKEETEDASGTTSTVTTTTTVITKTETTTTTTTTAAALPSVKDEVVKLAQEEPELRLTRRTAQQISAGVLYFKLGQENGYKGYVNQYTTNASALSKAQANEERIKKQHMSHKFSLTDVAAFKWVGSLHGGRTQLVNTLRQTMLTLESQLHVHFMHPNWSLLRKPWIGAVSASVTPRDFARALTVLKCCVKPILMLNVWKESLGHTQFRKITQQMREDKKKNEKRERKEKEEEDERLRPYMTFVKYTLGLKHQVSKQRGEEYRAHGQQGWLWLSSSRNYAPSDARKLGLRAGAFRLAVKYTDTRDDTFKIVLMEPKAFNYLLNKQEDLEKVKEEEANGEEDKPAAAVADAAAADANKSTERKKLEQALKFAKLERQEPTEDMFNDVIDVEAALSNPTRALFPNVAKKAAVIDDFLARRIQLKNLEERRIELKTGKLPEKPPPPPPPSQPQNVSKVKEEEVDVEGESDTQTTAVTDDIKKSDDDVNASAFVNAAKKQIWSMISKLKDVKEDSAACYSPSCLLKASAAPCYAPTCRLRPALAAECQEAESFYRRVAEDALKQGLDVSKDPVAFSSKDDAILKLQNLVKVLMIKKEEADRDSSVGISTVTTSTTSKTTVTVTKVNGDVSSVSTATESTVETASKQVKNGETSSASLVKTTSVQHGQLNHASDGKTELKAAETSDVVRVFSSGDTTGKLYLKRIQSVAESKARGKVVKYPLAPHFYAKARQKRNLLLLAKHDVKRMSRKAGVVTAEGFNYNSKSNSLIWPYPCPRPYFRTTWLYRTACADSIQAVAMQLKILWASIRWDDMSTRPPTTDGKHQVTTDHAICTTEILSHKNAGRFFERTTYLQRKVTIPLDVPKTVHRSDATPARSGLRKRKRAESPRQSEPQVLEEWMEEDKLELWEIRAYRERLERDKLAAMTRSRTGTVIREPQRLDPGAGDRLKRLEEPNKKLDDQIRQQRLLQQQKNQKTAATTTKIQIQSPQIITPSSGGGISLISNGPRPQVLTTPNTPTIIRRVRNPDGSMSLVRTTGPTARPLQATPTSAPALQAPTKKVFISKDGKVIGTQILQASPQATPARLVSPSTPTRPALQILPQTPTPPPPQKVQIVQSGDGKLQVGGLLPGQQILRMPDGKLQVVTQQPAAAAAASPALVQPKPSPILQQQQIVYPGGQVSPMKPTTTGAQIIATPLAPGSQIPSGMQAFVSGGKTYCIPKATTAMAKAQTTPTTTVMRPALASPQPTTTTTAIQTPGGGKQMVEVKPLGQNVVSFKGNQMIVSGPDVEQAQSIAKQLSSGQAKLATLNGKQVLISTSAAAAASPAKPEPPKMVQLPTQPLPQDAAAVATPQVTAQFVQTPQGPRIILQGIQCANIPKEQLISLQQQVKEELLKAQAEAKLHNKVPPTKIAINLPSSLHAFVKPEMKDEPVETTAAAGDATPMQPGQKVIMMNQQKVGIATPIGTVAQSVLLPHQKLPTTPVPATQLATPPAAAAAVNSPQAILSREDKFKLTPDYIQSAIQTALKDSNLSPETERKLIALQQHNQDHPVRLGDAAAARNKKKKAAIDPETGEVMDDEWEPYADSKLKSKKKAKAQREPPKARTAHSGSDTSSPLPPAVETPPPPPPAPAPVATPKPKPAAPATSPTKPQSPEEKKKREIEAKLQQMLLKHKEMLKRDIAKKRSLQERELQIDIHREIEGIKQQQAAEAESARAAASKRKRRESGEENRSAKKRKPEPKVVKKESKLHCVCKTKYDPTKFYVGCDVCNEWFHGSCVNITEVMSKRMKEYVCDDCKRAKDNHEIYCLCRQPYDETQYYIGCEGCSEWYHGRCVGILQSEADKIDEYNCPKCDPKSKLNLPNLKPLTPPDYDLIRKLVKQLAANRYACAFKEPVDPSDVPNYYKVVKEPMDLHTIDQRVNQQHYRTLSEFVGDVMRIFENCKFFNQPNSAITKNAEALESFFGQKLVLLRDKIVSG